MSAKICFFNSVKIVGFSAGFGMGFFFILSLSTFRAKLC